MPQILLDDENETLDWGNEEEEYQDAHRKHYPAPNPGDRLVGDDFDDTISLGDDEDDQRFYSISRHDGVSSSVSFNAVPPASPPSSRTKSTASAANPAQPGQLSLEHHTQAANVPAQETPKHQEAPHKNSGSRQSPPKSLPRLTHALPPKPVAASVTALSQPFIVAATTMTPRATGRESSKVNGNNGNSGSTSPDADFPQDWETRTSRKGETYYYNRVTHECTWTHPGGKPSVDASSAQEDSKSGQRRSVSPSSNKQSASYDSNTSRPQPSRSTRELSRNGNSENEPRRRPLTPDADGLTFEDRHYRPGLDSAPMSDGIRGFDRLDISTSAGRHARSRSPHGRRSPSPPGSDHYRPNELPRDQRSAQEKTTHSKTSFDSYVPDYDSRRWPPSPSRSPSDYHGRGRRDRASEEDRMKVDEYRPGSSFRRDDISRERRQRSRDRDLPPARSSDVREPSASQRYFSAQRSRSPAPLPPAKERDHDMWPEVRERDRLYEGHQPSSARSERGEKVPQPSEWDRSRQHERSPVPRSDQDYARRRQWPIDPDKDYVRGRSLDRERIRESERSERDRDLHNSRREVNIDTDRSSTHRPVEPYPPEVRGSQGDTKSKRNPESHDRKPEEPVSARLKRAPLPPQQAFFRSTQHRDAPPHPISTPSKRQDDNPRSTAGGDALPRRPRNSSSTVQSTSPDLSRPPNGIEADRFRDGHDRHERQTELSYDDKRMDVTRDEALHPGRPKLGLHDRGLLEDSQRSYNTPIDSGGRERSPQSRPTIIDNDRKDSKYDRPKDENPMNRESGSSRDDRPQPERSSSRRGRDAPKAARLTGTNNIPIGMRRTGFQTGATTQRPEALTSPGSTPLPDPLSSVTRILPPGKESYERPHDLVLSDAPRQSGSASRTELTQNRSLHERRRLQTRQDDEARSQRSLPPPPVINQHFNGSSYRPPIPPLLSSREFSNVPERPSGYPSSDGRSVYHTSQNAERPAKYRDEPTLRPDSYREGHLSYSPRRLPADEADGGYGFDPLPPRKSLPGGADVDAKFSSSGELKRSPVDRSDFLSRVEPPTLRRGGSLLDRLSVDTKDRGSAPESRSALSSALRDRLVPSKRDRDEMMNSEGSSGRGVQEEKAQDIDGSESKRARKRGGKRRSAARRV